MGVQYGWWMRYSSPLYSLDRNFLFLKSLCLEGIIMLGWLMAMVFVVQQGENTPTPLESALLESTKISQQAIDGLSRNESIRYREYLGLAKNALVRSGVKPVDGFGIVMGGRYVVPNKKMQQGAIDHWRNQLAADEKKARQLFVDMIPVIGVNDLSKGQAGYLGESTTILAEVRVLQVLGDSSFLGKVGGETILVRDASTEDIVDGKEFYLSRPVEVLGTERYTTVAGGSNTVFAVRLLGRDEWQKALKYLEMHKLKPKMHLREWKDGDGNLIVEAEYVTQSKTTVTVRDKENKEQELPIAQLGKDDKAWLKDR